MEISKRELNAQIREYEAGREFKKGVENGRLELWELEKGDVIRVVAGEEASKQYIYEFEIRSAQEEPLVNLKQTAPDGSVVHFEDYEVTLRGSGNWV